MTAVTLPPGYSVDFRIVCAEALAIDQKVATESACDKCGHNSLTFLPCSSDGAYVAIARCSVCGHLIEF